MPSHRIKTTVFLGIFAIFTPLLAAQAAEPDDGFVSLFDGKTLDGWKAPDMGYWSVEDGAITAKSSADKPAKANQFLVWQLGEVDDFELRFRFRISGHKGANAGVQFRSAIDDKGHAIGYQADIDLGKKWLGCLYDEHGRGMLGGHAQIVTIDPDGTKKVNQLQTFVHVLHGVDPTKWTDYRIVARGPHLQIYVNGQPTTEVTDRSKKDADAIGKLALQLHSGPAMTVQYKDIRLKRLPLADGKKKVVFVAGKKSHGFGAHEHNAGSLLLAKLLNENHPGVLATVYQNGFPKDPTAFDNADAAVFYADGGGRHPVNPHLDKVAKHVKARGMGVACLHYGVEVPKGPSGEALLNWIGGYFETNWSVNPWWVPTGSMLAEHPITRGVGPIEINDEWYYHMRFQPEGVTPILSALPPKTTLRRKDGAHSNNPHVRKSVLEDKQPQHVAWAYERPKDAGGGRGFGFTGAHVHWNWAHDHFRKLVVNAVAWTAGADVPEKGIVTPTPTLEQLEANQDFDRPANYKREKLAEFVESIKKMAK